MRLDIKGRTVYVTPRLFDASTFFADWLFDTEHVAVKNPGTSEWRMTGRHRLFGKFLARWKEGAVGNIVLTVSQI
jgi:hypothetical protein